MDSKFYRKIGIQNYTQMLHSEILDSMGFKFYRIIGFQIIRKHWIPNLTELLVSKFDSKFYGIIPQ